MIAIASGAKQSCILGNMKVINSEKGFALVLTLMILVLITAMVVEFSYGVYTTTSALNNWKVSQRLSLVAKSGIRIAVKTISDSTIQSNDLYMYLGRDIPLENVSEGFTGRLIIKAEDENAKFNLNSLVWPTGQKKSYDSFIRLLDYLGLDESIADRVVHWTNTVSNLGLRYSEDITKGAPMDSVDELLLIKGIDYQTYEKLLPYITVYGYGGHYYDEQININTASIPVIMCIGNMSESAAEDIVEQRLLKSYTQGFTSINSTYAPPINFRITSIAEENKIKRVIEAVVTIQGSQVAIKYWREM